MTKSKIIRYTKFLLLITIGITANTIMHKSFINFTLFLVSIFIVLGTILLIKTKEKQVLLMIVVPGILLRLFLLQLETAGIILPGGGSDAIMFKKIADYYANIWTHKLIFISSAPNYYYSKFIAVIEMLFGTETLMPVLINIICSTLTAYIIYKITMMIFHNNEISFTASLIFYYFPSIILYSVLTLRETVTIFLLSLFFLLSIAFIKYKNLEYFLPAIGILYLANLFDNVTIIVDFSFFIWIIIFMLYKLIKISLKEKIISVLIVSISFVAFVAMIRKYPIILGKIPYKNISSLFSIHYITMKLNVAARGKTAYLVNFLPHSYLSFILQTPIRMLYFLFSPFLWQLHSLKDMVGLFDSIMYLVLILSFVLEMKNFKKFNNKYKEILIFSAILLFFMIFFFAWGVSNTGTALRHRTFLLFVLIPVATHNLVNVANKIFKFKLKLISNKGCDIANV